METRRFTFNSDQMEMMAQFTSELIRQGVTFDTNPKGDGFEIIMTGGY